jgi:GNAT superfamily N-acetyltransferase
LSNGESAALIEYRPVRDTDPPKLAEIWRLQGTTRGLMQPMSMAVLERYVLAKPYFERGGLTVAVDDAKVVGFAHAGFGPSPRANTLAREQGVTCLVMLRPETDRSVAAELVARCEAYLRAAGATTLLGGGGFPLSPFYHGLYGGSECSGILEPDAAMQAVFREAGYRERQRSVVLRRDVATFRSMVDRQQMQIRRHNVFEYHSDAPTTTWWEACVFEPFDRTLATLVPREGGAPAAGVYLWGLETMLGAWGVQAVGIADLVVPAARQRQGLARFLLGEAIRQLHSQGVAMAEVHVPVDNAPAQAIFRSLGFEEVDQAVQFVKE